MNKKEIKKMIEDEVIRALKEHLEEYVHEPRD